MRRTRAQFYCRPTTPFTPASLPLFAWYDPNDAATLFQSGTRAAPGAAAVVGSPVGLMLDKSGNNNDATAAGIACPTLRQDGSGFYYLDFNGASNAMTVPSAAALTQGAGIFAAKRPVDPPAGGATAGPVLGNFGTDAAGNYYPFTDGTVYSGFLSNARHDTGANPGDFSTWHVGDFRSKAANWRGAFNGVEYGATAANTVAGGASPRIGRNSQEETYYLGFVGSILICTDFLTAGQIANARTWIGAQVGVAV